MNNSNTVTPSERAVFEFLFHCARYEGAAGAVDMLEGAEREEERRLYETRATVAREGMEQAIAAAAGHYGITHEVVYECISYAADELEADPAAPSTNVEMLRLAKAACEVMEAASPKCF